MDFPDAWRELRDRIAELDPDTVLVTPSSERAFGVTAVDPEYIEIRYRESDDDRRLWRDQFAVLQDRLDDPSEEILLSDLPPGVEPYVSVLSVSPRYRVDEADNTLRQAADGEAEESPFVRPEWEARTVPERLRDDVLLLYDFLVRNDGESPEDMSTDPLVNLYVLLSDVQRGADRMRRTVRDALLDRIGPDAQLHGQYGTVRRTHRERRHLKPEDEVIDLLEERGIPLEWVTGIDTDKLDVVLAVTDIDPADVYEIEEQVYVQKTDVGEETKQSRLQGLEDRLALLDEDEADELRHEIEDFEDRLDELLAA